MKLQRMRRNPYAEGTWQYHDWRSKQYSKRAGIAFAVAIGGFALSFFLQLVAAVTS